MNRIAILADIHGNRPALEAVISDIQQQGVDGVRVGGDLVGRGPQGSEVVHRIRELKWPSIMGNHEEYLLGFIRKTVQKEWWTEDIWAASRWMAHELDAEAVRYIEALPFTLTPPTDKPFRLFHGSPKSHSEGIGAWTSDEVCLSHLGSMQESALVCGHTHRPLLREFEEGVIVNVGSVGLPFNGDWRAQYAIVHRDSPALPWTATFRQVEYDREEFLRVYETSGFLRGGHTTALLLKYEVETARPFLVPFLIWHKKKELEPTFENLDVFLEQWDPTLPIAELMKQLNRVEKK